MTSYVDRGENADWTKTTWDLVHVSSVDDLRGYLVFVGWALGDFKESPTYAAGVKTQKWLADAVEQIELESGLGVPPF